MNALFLHIFFIIFTFMVMCTKNNIMHCITFEVGLYGKGIMARSDPSLFYCQVEKSRAETYI